MFAFRFPVGDIHIVGICRHLFEPQTPWDGRPLSLGVDLPVQTATIIGFGWPETIMLLLKKLYVLSVIMAFGNRGATVMIQFSNGYEV